MVTVTVVSMVLGLLVVITGRRHRGRAEERDNNKKGQVDRGGEVKGQRAQNTQKGYNRFWNARVWPRGVVRLMRQ